MSTNCHCRCGHDPLTPVTQTLPDTWLHYGVVVTSGRRGALYAALGGAAGDMLEAGRAREFFFLHKPPGLRIRFQPTADSRADLEGELDRRLRRWQRDGLVDSWRGGAYEPEEYLFGGAVSMRSVHRIFTADSLAWLDFHSAAHDDGDRRPGPAWAMSLLMVRALLDALAIVGWEDLDVWDRLRWQAGRRLTDEGRRPAAYGRIEAALRSGWAAPQRLAGLLSPSALRLVEDYRAALTAAGADWWDTYFGVGRPAVGPREAAAFVTVFHWNRARLSALYQALIAEALTCRPGQVAQ